MFADGVQIFRTKFAIVDRYLITVSCLQRDAVTFLAENCSSLKLISNSCDELFDYFIREASRDVSRSSFRGFHELHERKFNLILFK